MGMFGTSLADLVGGWTHLGASWARQSPEAAAMMSLAASVTLFLVVIVGGAVRKI